MGLLIGPFFDTALAGVEPEETGSAGGTLPPSSSSARKARCGTRPAAGPPHVPGVRA
ncbi:hypothetical protein [Actinomadura sp. KC216]|uniref:hypothetical protein n=1 Tax=Actinomadura sp. KC216 TaxID=2530370 RepID=UPI001404AB40|nr:hypothetical protein [Actinomadura sp. KC216]